MMTSEYWSEKKNSITQNTNYACRPTLNSSEKWKKEQKTKKKKKRTRKFWSEFSLFSLSLSSVFVSLLHTYLCLSLSPDSIFYSLIWSVSLCDMNQIMMRDGAGLLWDLLCFFSAAADSWTYLSGHIRPPTFGPAVYPRQWPARQMFLHLTMWWWKKKKKKKKKKTMNALFRAPQARTHARNKHYAHLIAASSSSSFLQSCVSKDSLPPPLSDLARW